MQSSYIYIYDVASQQKVLASLVIRVLDLMNKSRFSVPKLTEFSCCENYKMSIKRPLVKI